MAAVQGALAGASRNLVWPVAGSPCGLVGLRAQAGPYPAGVEYGRAYGSDTTACKGGHRATLACVLRYDAHPGDELEGATMAEATPGEKRGGGRSDARTAMRGLWGGAVVEAYVGRPSSQGPAGGGPAAGGL